MLLTSLISHYDYAVGKAGFLKYDSELGAYLFTAKSGEKLPSVLANYRPLTLAEAILDIQDRRIIIQGGETKPGDRLFSEAVPKLRNGQALAHVIGYAYDITMTK